MDAKDLRIGNYVYFMDEIRVIDGIRNAQSHLKSPVYFVDLGYKYQKKVLVLLEDIKPIPVTKERLIELGFEIFGDSELRKAGLYFTELEAGEFMCFFHVHCIKNVYHIHQVQNIYYVLTGEDLIK